MSTLGTILKDNWTWRRQIAHLALFDLKKQTRGAALGWAWFVIRPAIYIFCLWFAFEIGLRAAKVAPGSAPYILWLAAGVIPWFFMRDILSHGIDVMHRYPYLVNKVKFPISGITSIYIISAFLIHLIMQVMLFVVYFACGQPLDVYLLQVPLLLFLMVVFWWFFSLLMSPLCVISKDVKNLVISFTTPLFWLSGVIFNVRDVPVDWIQAILYFNPITSFVTAFRDALYEKAWVWDDPMLCICFAVVFVATMAMALLVYSRTNEGVVDVL